MYKDVFFLDIETVPEVASFDELEESKAVFWSKKAALLGIDTEEKQKALYAEKAGIFAEFGKIVTIAFGRVLAGAQGRYVLHVKGMSSHEEKEVLEAFKKEVERFSAYSLRLCGHNIKEFDIPYICRRMIVHGMALPSVLDVAGKKPWEVNYVDTMELWKFGDRKNYAPLDLLAYLFGIPSSKKIMQGHEVGEYYYKKKDLEAIESYCKDDVVATARVFCRLKGLSLPSDVVLH